MADHYDQLELRDRVHPIEPQYECLRSGRGRRRRRDDRREPDVAAARRAARRAHPHAHVIAGVRQQAPDREAMGARAARIRQQVPVISRGAVVEHGGGGLVALDHDRRAAGRHSRHVHGENRGSDCRRGVAWLDRHVAQHHLRRARAVAFEAHCDRAGVRPCEMAEPVAQEALARKYQTIPAALEAAGRGDHIVGNVDRAGQRHHRHACEMGGRVGP